ncbi:hypothetical protein GQ44DRAFT_829225 [Phaeosphaeriaceae sp. PMI808]|nr:hypothetical protein GQ44DRAFT_829225 [Phaeosphaeriaceae sp. PMI808]
MTEAVFDWLALAVEEVDEKKLLPGLIGKDGMRPHLPTQMVKIPFDDPNQVAVVSWRWDGDLQTRGSRNIASVIHCAKQRGIRYLFIDIISIDQTLPASDLIKLVAAFSALYTKITVLAAYDMDELDCLDLRYTVLRPWILNEMRLFRQNPGRIVYVGHSNQGSKSANYVSQGILPIQTQTTRSHFESLLEEIWRTSFVDSIIGVLLEEIGMSFVSDFKYIIPAYSHVFSVAYEQMERNDYLLTTAILCRIHGASGILIGGQDLERSIQYLRYCRYNFNQLPYDKGSSFTFYEISLDGTPVALWNHKYNFYQEYHRYEFRTLPDTERVIFAALRLPESEYENFVGEKEARRACLVLDNRKEIPPPALEVIEVSRLSE